MSRSTWLYLGLLFILACTSGLSLFSSDLPPLPLPLPLMLIAIGGLVFAVYGLLGWLGLFLARQQGFPDLLDPTISSRERLLKPAMAGSVLGIVLILADLLFASWNGIGRLAHPTFPMSLAASLSAGIGEELIFRLFFISFWTWVFSRLLRGRHFHTVFWIVAVASSLAFAAAHYPALMTLYHFSSPLAMPLALNFEIVLLNGLIGIWAAYYFRKSGYLSAVTLHLSADVVWHVVWGLLSLALLS